MYAAFMYETKGMFHAIDAPPRPIVIKEMSKIATDHVSIGYNGALILHLHNGAIVVKKPSRGNIVNFFSGEKMARCLDYGVFSV